MYAIWILVLLLVISLTVNFLMIREVYNIYQEVNFLIENNTQMRISTGFSIGPFDQLAEIINKFLDSYHNKEKAYINKEKYLQNTIRGLSHDIRTPLTSLDGYLQVIADNKEDSDNDKYLSIMKNRINSLNSILDQLFTFIKLQEEEYILEMEKIDITSLALETLFNYYEDFKLRNIEPTIDFTKNKVFILANKDGLCRIFQNIYKNILEHGQSPIHLSLREVDDKIIFVSKNKMKDDLTINKNDVFKEFYKASDSRTGSSTGLGLAICKGLAEKMNGEISADIDGEYFSIILSFDKIKKSSK
ncbi:HAMP domain-containing sensor histidine kinase [Anaerococcus sp. Marseille-Q7828]|uniref:sensor histidine kinase n=1 Tax=Anaerococcus sp. Marseille-Q7828 TaxID=3036300 RepID=UPI0024AE1AFA|nr:HAMP domain-containing sensor histidine kinase [Anaerococcus sp. Marseille-Q7828]